uniref:hypothetical protein n=1 Tax=Aeromonas veronii TaxID=654 RepID=UPI003D1A2CF2
MLRLAGCQGVVMSEVREYVTFLPKMFRLKHDNSETEQACLVRIPVKLNSDSGICEHHFRKVCGQGF